MPCIRLGLCSLLLVASMQQMGWTQANGGARGNRLLSRDSSDSQASTLVVDASKHTLDVAKRQRLNKIAARLKLEPSRAYTVTVTGSAHLAGIARSQPGPLADVVVIVNDAQRYPASAVTKLLKQGATLSFITPDDKAPQFLTAFFIDNAPDAPNTGQYTLRLEATPAKLSKPVVPGDIVLSRAPNLDPRPAVQTKPAPRGEPSADAHRIVNINFGRDPDNGSFDGVVGGPHDIWTLFDVGERQKVGIPFADGTGSDVTVDLSANDGEWGIPGTFDVYHAYLYHNCRCVDLSVRIRHLPPGTYDAYVFAHGDAPDQNAAIEIISAGTTYSGRATLNDGTHRYRSRDYEEGNQYVKYTIQVRPGQPVTITSKRDGSTLSMFNAIQFEKLD